MDLQLADNTPDIRDFYIAVPNDKGGVDWMREDKVMKYPDQVVEEIILFNLEMEENGMSGLFSGIRDKMAGFVRKIQDKRQKEGKKVFFPKLGNRLDSAVDPDGNPKPQAPQKGKATFQQSKMQLPTTQGGQQKGMFGNPSLNISGGVNQWWQNPVVIVGGLGLAGLIVYGVTKKK